MTRDPNIRKSDVYGTLKKAWQGTDDPAEIIKELATFQNAFIDLVVGTNSQKHPKPAAALFRNLYAAGAPTSTYPFLMQLSNALNAGSVQLIVCVEVLQVVESFLVRRAICGHEPTGLHAVFKKLWSDCNASPTAPGVSAQIRAHKTVAWPDKEDTKRAIEQRPLYGVGVTPYILLEYDRSLGGDQPANVPWVEHILPVKPAVVWFKQFKREEHERMKDLLANLVPLSQEMNINVSNQGYAVKRPKFEKDSMFKSARVLGKENPTWTPALMRKRGKRLAEWAVGRWAY